MGMADSGRRNRSAAVQASGPRTWNKAGGEKDDDATGSCELWRVDVMAHVRGFRLLRAAYITLSRMNSTSRHLLTAVGWLFVLPLLAVATVLAFGVSLPQYVSVAISVLWAFGFAGIFWSWASRDVSAHGKSRAAAAWFTAAWLLLHFVAVIPYLLFTRGVRGGLVATLKFVCFCLACAIAWLGVPVLIRLFQ